jgi:hypothetical protein
MPEADSVAWHQVERLAWLSAKQTTQRRNVKIFNDSNEQTAKEIFLSDDWQLNNIASQSWKIVLVDWRTAASFTSHEMCNKRREKMSKCWLGKAADLTLSQY